MRSKLAGSELANLIGTCWFDSSVIRAWPGRSLRLARGRHTGGMVFEMFERAYGSVEYDRKRLSLAKSRVEYLDFGR